MLEEKKAAPNFELKDQDGSFVKLSDYAGKNVVLYFYPKDDTPGCTVEACGFRDNYAAFEENGIVVLGVSPDDPRSHAKFIQKFDLPFTLLADTDHAVAESYGVWGLKKFMGKEYMGVLRTTFVIGPDQNLLKIFSNVKPENHYQEILALFGRS